jgi:hypothetical protein
MFVRGKGSVYVCARCVCCILICVSGCVFEYVLYCNVCEHGVCLCMSGVCVREVCVWRIVQDITIIIIITVTSDPCYHFTLHSSLCTINTHIIPTEIQHILVQSANIISPVISNTTTTIISNSKN